MNNNNETEKGNSHRWRFFRAGGFDQVRLDSAEDLRHLGELDQKLWVALACPVRGLEFDERTLALIDSDGDGRIRAPEIIAATQWACSLLKNPEDLLKRSPSLPLAAIREDTEEGGRLLASARQVLSDLGKPQAEEITVEDLADTNRIFSATRFNGDGVIQVEAADEAAIKSVITEIMACFGSVPDRSGLDGIGKEHIDNFFTSLAAYDGWWQKGEAGGAATFPLGGETVAAMALVEQIRGKVEDYFVRCRLAAYDPKAVESLSGTTTNYLALAEEDLSAATPLTTLPLALVGAGKPLPLDSGINPAWSAAVTNLRRQVIVPILGERDELTEDEWRQLLDRLAPCAAWLGAKQGAEVERLDIDRIREILAGGFRQEVEALLARDLALAPQAATIADVERLVRYYRDLFALLNNFVSFRDFYSRKEKAVFQAGSLYIDGRSCDLCLRVADAAKHATLATAGHLFIVYCDCTRRGSTEKITIAASFTDGDAGFLFPGRNGIFYDRQGRDWDATITKIVEHPISIREAFWSPYKQIGKMIGEQLQKVANLREKAFLDQATGSIAAAGKTLQGEKTPPPPPFDAAKFAGIFAAIGLAIGAIGSAVASLATGFLQLTWWQMPVALAGVMLIASGPSMIAAYLKLRERNVGPLLDASGWAMNTRAKINIPFGASLTSLARLPEGAERSLTDPYAEEEKPWKLYLTLVAVPVVLLILWKLGGFSWLCGKW